MFGNVLQNDFLKHFSVQMKTVINFIIFKIFFVREEKISLIKRDYNP